jgi:hypothetical protein
MLAALYELHPSADRSTTAGGSGGALDFVRFRMIGTVIPFPSLYAFVGMVMLVGLTQRTAS